MQTKVLSVDNDGIAQAAALLCAGQLVAFPTETVYGLGADATNGEAVAAIFAAKNRPSFNPLIVHVPDVDTARHLVTWSETADRLASAFWPGALTLVLPLARNGPVADLAAAGLPSLAVRVPAHPVARALLAETGRPVAAPSANPSGRISPVTAAHVQEGLSGRIAAVLDGGTCDVGLESTIVGLTGDRPVLLRPGGVPREAIEAALGVPLSEPAANAPLSAPGQLTSHYAPGASVRINATKAQPGEYLIGFGPVAGDDSLSRAGDLREAAANLFACLHRADASGKPIAVAPVPETGLGAAINDRLRRAAAPRGSEDV